MNTLDTNMHLTDGEEFTCGHKSRRVCKKSPVRENEKLSSPLFTIWVNWVVINSSPFHVRKWSLHMRAGHFVAIFIFLPFGFLQC